MWSLGLGLWRWSCHKTCCIWCVCRFSDKSISEVWLRETQQPRHIWFIFIKRSGWISALFFLIFMSVQLQPPFLILFLSVAGVHRGRACDAVWRRRHCRERFTELYFQGGQTIWNSFASLSGPQNYRWVRACFSMGWIPVAFVCNQKDKLEKGSWMNTQIKLTLLPGKKKSLFDIKLENVTQSHGERNLVIVFLRRWQMLGEKKRWFFFPSAVSECKEFLHHGCPSIDCSPRASASCVRAWHSLCTR